jgi:hypothetical protein
MLVRFDHVAKLYLGRYVFRRETRSRFFEIAFVFVRLDHVASFYQRHDRENLPFSIHLDVALIGCSTRGAVIDFIAV